MPTTDLVTRFPDAALATSTRNGVMRTAGSLKGSGAAPVLDPVSAPVGVHSHARLHQIIRPFSHSNNLANGDLYTPNLNADPAIASTGNYAVVLNSNFAFTLRSDGIDTGELATGQAGQVTSPFGREPTLHPVVAQGSVFPRNEEFSSEVWVMLIQDDVGSRVPTFATRQSTVPLGVPSLTGGTAGQWRLLGFRYLGPWFGWRMTHDSGSWQGSLPYTIAASSTRGGKYLRALQGTAGATVTGLALDAFEKSPLTWRKKLYELGVFLEVMTAGPQSAFLSGNQVTGFAVTAGLTNAQFVRHTACSVPNAGGDPVAPILHELGHATNGLFGNLTGDGTGALIYSDTTLNSIYAADLATYQAAGGPPTSQFNFGWTGSYSYFINSQDEWIAQVIGSYMHRKYLVANSQATTVADTHLTEASNPTQRTALLARLDTLFAAYNT